MNAVHTLVQGLHQHPGMGRAWRFFRAALECSGEVGLALSASLVAVHFLWLQWEQR